MQMFQHSFVRNEKNGIHAIDQSPLKKGFKPLRLYVFPDEPTKTLFIITLGEKDGQNDDINECAKFVQSVIANRESGVAKPKDTGAIVPDDEPDVPNEAAPGES